MGDQTDQKSTATLWVFEDTKASEEEITNGLRRLGDYNVTNNLLDSTTAKLEFKDITGQAHSAVVQIRRSYRSAIESVGLISDSDVVCLDSQLPKTSNSSDHEIFAGIRIGASIRKAFLSCKLIWHSSSSIPAEIVSLGGNSISTIHVASAFRDHHDNHAPNRCSSNSSYLEGWWKIAQEIERKFEDAFSPFVTFIPFYQSIQVVLFAIGESKPDNPISTDLRQTSHIHRDSVCLASARRNGLWNSSESLLSLLKIALAPLDNFQDKIVAGQLLEIFDFGGKNSAIYKQKFSQILEDDKTGTLGHFSIGRNVNFLEQAANSVCELYRKLLIVRNAGDSRIMDFYMSEYDILREAYFGSRLLALVFL